MANTTKSKNNGLNWILWWQIDQEELDKQVKGYATLGITKSARGISFLLLLLSSIITGILIMLNLVDMATLVDIAILMTLGVFTLKGKKWAMLGAMIVWSLEKLLSISAASGASLVTVIIWWTAYMHMFYLAYKTELARK